MEEGDIIPTKYEALKQSKLYVKMTYHTNIQNLMDIKDVFQVKCGINAFVFFAVTKDTTVLDDRISSYIRQTLRIDFS